MTDAFQKVTGFCSDCGSILPPLKSTGGVSCYTCSKNFEPQMLVDKNSEVHYTIHFNVRSVPTKNSNEQKEDEDEGPVVERKCPKCGNEKMSYATLQLRSADEGQTVFYTCTKCKFKESENS
ncbi:DNA-directed RNA polymerase I subunit RPA12 [Anthonomus grandis grandis]|uniref:DNA-directed RNA polymerase I subunit RPA12 n=1 Tax=Anthonomus grandis grandis TaxID=2921223 RepID=UPI00216559F6|nr:DNA-directed RNA polymerase I subunit RPA12 [Anthonomus grandis grandis]